MSEPTEMHPVLLELFDALAREEGLIDGGPSWVRFLSADAEIVAKISASVLAEMIHGSIVVYSAMLWTLRPGTDKAEVLDLVARRCRRRCSLPVTAGDPGPSRSPSVRLDPRRDGASACRSRTFTSQGDPRLVGDDRLGARLLVAAFVVCGVLAVAVGLALAIWPD
ncbi:hypothetical protein [Microbacterium sp. CPCC 204701]|uniref:hypothetical protein n=1 Tax=Microbacterium sp. CPCC 204701 TaxID=2493084 RepID=UPI000FD81639|nr:hypothetical protein [Microbacterium sp. CPCC 204701]